MKKFSKVISAILTVATVVSMLTCSLSVSAADPAVNKLTGTTKLSSKSLASGVTYASYKGKAYGASANLQFDVVEVDMSSKNLYIDNVYGGKTAAHAYKGGASILSSFKSANSSLTPIAAINADLWWMYTDSAKENLAGNGSLLAAGSSGHAMSLGFSMSNGEIYTSDRLPGESFIARDGKQPLNYENYVSFGITSDSVPVISNPDVELTVKNTTQNKTTPADGVNRLPVNNAIVMYTDKGPKQSYCNTDAVEVKIKCSAYTVKHGAKITGTVESVSLAGKTRPTMTADSNYIILTARGTRYNDLSGYKTGDKIEISVNVFDRDGKYTKEWQKVTDAISGHLRFATDGTYSTNNVAISTSYPATLIGITKSGNVVMMTYGQAQTGTARQGIASGGIVQLCKDLDLKDGFVLDGGGSTQMYLKEGTSYVHVNNPTEPNRSLLNLLVLSTGPNRAAQGTIPAVASRDKDMTTLDFSKEGNNWYLSDQTPVERKGNDVKFRYDETQKALKVTTLSTKDPYIEIDYSASSPKVSATSKKYLAIEYMLPTTNSSKATKGQIFLNGKTMGNTSTYTRDGKYHTMVIDYTSKATWKSNVSKLRFDIFASASSGDTIYIKSIKFLDKNPNATPVPTAKPSATTAPATKPPATQAPVTTAPVVTEGIVVTEAPVTEAPVEDVPAEDPVDDGEESGLPMGAIIGIIAGGVVLAAAIVVTVILISKKKK
ncbi:MAG: hypothetical protein E7384_00830 [Ruminococcaceae bacterium]|nr:hypothetical protein [Oscillospiraceae bacterium]